VAEARSLRTNLPADEHVIEFPYLADMTRSKGSGSLYRDTRGYWTAVIPLPAIDGKRRREVFRSRRKSEAEAWLADRLPRSEEPDWNHLTVND
jgi:hypothetical protein